MRGGYPLRIAEWLSRGWSVFTKEGGLFLAFSAISLFAVVLSLLGATTIGLFVAWPIVILATPLLGVGFLAAALVVRRGDALQVSDFLLPFHDFIPILLATVVACALLFAGLCTCGIVTIYLFVGYLFAYLLILDRRMDFWDALESSRKVATKEWFGLFAFALVLFLINVAGLLAACVGLIVTVPLTACALVEAYADIFGVRGGLRRTPMPPAAAAPPPASFPMS